MNLRQQSEARLAALRALYPNLVPALPVISRTDPTSIVLGRSFDRKPVLLPLRYRFGHLFLTGTTGSGKSRLLLHTANQIINNDEGLISIEPHGANSDALIRLLANSSKTVHIIDFASPHCIPFNPLWCPPGSDPSVIAGCALDAVSVSRDDEPMHTKPTTERVLMTIFYTAAALNLTLVELPMLLDAKDEHGLRAYAIQQLKDPYTRNDLKRLHELSQDGRRRRDFDQEIIGPLNRLARLIRPQVLRTMLGQSKNTLDIGAVMDRGEIIIAKLAAGSQVYEADADLLGRLLVRSVLFHAKRRATTHPCTLMIDEASRYFSGDIPVLLTEIRKFHVSVVAALQYLQQAQQHDDNMLAALLNCCNVQIAFRAGDAEESERRAHSMIPLDLEVPVNVLTKPVVVGHRLIELKNKSDSTQESVTDSASHTEGENEGVSETEAHMIATTVGTSHGTADTVSSSNMHSLSDTESDSASSSTMNAVSGGSSDATGASTGEVLWTNDGVLTSTEVVSSRSSRGTSESHGKTSGTQSGHSDGTAKDTSRGRTRGSAHSRGRTINQTTMTATTEAESFAVSRSYGRSRADTVGRAHARGTGQSNGYSEALEPILQGLPTAVHSKDNMLYKAGQLLRGLPTGTAFISFVRQDGPYASLFTVPPVFAKPLPPERAATVLANVLSRSPIVLPVEQAVQNISDREQAIVERCKPQNTSTQQAESERSNKKGTWGR